MQLEIVARPLIREDFAPFGEVIATEGLPGFPINEGRARRFHALAAVDAAQAGGRPVISVFRTDPVGLPFALRLLERHRLGSQAFIPLHEQPFLVVVAPNMAGDKPGVPIAFITDGRQGVNFHAGTWHSPLLALHGTCDFLVVDRDGPVVDCDEVRLELDCRVTVIPG